MVWSVFLWVKSERGCEGGGGGFVLVESEIYKDVENVSECAG